MNALEMALAAARAAAEKQAADIVVLDVKGPFGLADHFVIASALSERQAKTVVDEVERALREGDGGMRPIRREGENGGGWLLLDYGDVIVHVFSEEQREYYDLERLWRDAPKVEWEDPAEAERRASSDADPAGEEPAVVG